ncbi:hypothetical protein ACYPKM_00585 [Pseudomonas aeruginosa]
MDVSTEKCTLKDVILGIWMMLKPKVLFVLRIPYEMWVSVPRAIAKRTIAELHFIPFVLVVLICTTVFVVTFFGLLYLLGWALMSLVGCGYHGSLFATGSCLKINTAAIHAMRLDTGMAVFVNISAALFVGFVGYCIWGGAKKLIQKACLLGKTVRSPQ